jgi:hypothetical protein
MGAVPSGPASSGSGGNILRFFLYSNFSRSREEGATSVMKLSFLIWSGLDDRCPFFSLLRGNLGSLFEFMPDDLTLGLFPAPEVTEPVDEYGVTTIKSGSRSDNERSAISSVLLGSFNLDLCATLPIDMDLWKSS